MICGALQTLNEDAFEDVVSSERASPTGEMYSQFSLAPIRESSELSLQPRLTYNLTNPNLTELVATSNGTLNGDNGADESESELRFQFGRGSIGAVGGHHSRSHSLHDDALSSVVIIPPAYPASTASTLSTNTTRPTNAPAGGSINDTKL